MSSALTMSWAFTQCGTDVRGDMASMTIIKVRTSRRLFSFLVPLSCLCMSIRWKISRPLRIQVRHVQFVDGTRGIWICIPCRQAKPFRSTAKSAAE